MTDRRSFCALTLPLLSLWLGACQPQSVQPSGSVPAPDQPDACGASRAAKFISAADTPAQRAAITTASGARAIRWLTPGMAVTMDYRQDRLNANISADGRFTGFGCG